jgi:uncharacterized protein YggU (UPF0235/DUF167 family)
VAGVDVREHGTGVIVAVQVRPRSQPGLEVTEAGLVIRVAAPPEKGRATDHARRALAEALDVPASSVELRSGPASRRKTFIVESISPLDARSRLLAKAKSL